VPHARLADACRARDQDGARERLGQALFQQRPERLELALAAYARPLLPEQRPHSLDRFPLSVELDGLLVGGAVVLARELEARVEESGGHGVDLDGPAIGPR
jgi:hypothetical protein